MNVFVPTRFLLVPSDVLLSNVCEIRVSPERLIKYFLLSSISVVPSLPNLLITSLFTSVVPTLCVKVICLTFWKPPLFFHFNVAVMLLDNLAKSYPPSAYSVYGSVYASAYSSFLTDSSGLVICSISCISATGKEGSSSPGLGWFEISSGFFRIKNQYTKKDTTATMRKINVLLLLIYTLLRFYYYLFYIYLI